jgi:ribosomal protein S18 acetylase RimI-like enzyme
MGRALVAESDGEVVGIVIRFPGSAWGRIRRAMGRAMLGAVGWRRVMILYWRGRPMDRLMGPVAPDAMHVMSLAVTPARRGQGIGAELMARVAEEARSGRLRSVTLDVDMDNDAAIRFYEREGFVRVEERHIPAGRGLPELGSIRMLRELSP